MPRPPKAPPPKHLLEERHNMPDQGKELSEAIQAFVEKLELNEEATNALLEAPVDVQRRVVQEAKEVPNGRSASAAVKFRVVRYTRLLKAEAGPGRA
eukprot:g12102.t1